MTDAATVPAPTRQLLAWIAERPRTYTETMEAWKTSCPRLSVWEDALADSLVRVRRGEVQLTPAGIAVLTGGDDEPGHPELATASAPIPSGPP